MIIRRLNVGLLLILLLQEVVADVIPHYPIHIESPLSHSNQDMVTSRFVHF